MPCPPKGRIHGHILNVGIADPVADGTPHGDDLFALAGHQKTVAAGNDAGDERRVVSPRPSTSRHAGKVRSIERIFSRGRGFKKRKFNHKKNATKGRRRKIKAIPVVVCLSRPLEVCRSG
jgi:hypothetical protein